MNDQRYVVGKPADCAYCYFWDRKKRACAQKECYYVAKGKQETGGQTGECQGCPYGRIFPCIGYCLQKIIREMKLQV